MGDVITARTVCYCTHLLGHQLTRLYLALQLVTAHEPRRMPRNFFKEGPETPVALSGRRQCEFRLPAVSSLTDSHPLAYMGLIVCLFGPTSALIAFGGV